jgi:hypothetical protein
MSESWRRVANHVQLHHGVLSAAAAQRLDIATSTLATWTAQGRLLRVAPEVYLVAGAPDSWHQQATIATASTAGWLSHRAAAALWQLDGFQQQEIEVLTAKGRRHERRGDWLVHETRRFRAVDLTEVDGVPCTTVARTILDLPAVAHITPIGQALDNACNRWPEMLDLVGQRFLELGGRGRSGTRILRMMLEERTGTRRFAQSGFESRTQRLVQAVGLPVPVLQHEVRDGSFAAYLDLAWPRVLWAIECDSLAWHSGKKMHESDRQRRRHLKRLGWDLVEVTWDDVTKRRDTTARELRDLYRSREASVLSLLSSQLRAEQRQNLRHVKS